MKKTYIIVAIILIIIFGLFAVYKNKNSPGSDNGASGKIDVSGLDSLSKDLNSLGSSMDSLNDDVELDSAGSSSSDSSSETPSLSGLESSQNDLAAYDSSMGGLNDNEDL
mgnify:CR=1 FL=1